MLAFTNFILPILLYIEASNQILVYESNYKESALLDFENFLILKSQEIGLEIQNDEKTMEFYEQIERMKLKLNLEKENEKEYFNLDKKEDIENKEDNKESNLIDEDKEKIIEKFYEYEGHYSTISSIINIIGIVFNYLIY